MFIQALELKDFLSFQDVTLKLGPVNVLIGPNGSGKSNLIDAVDFLQHAAGDLSSFVLNHGGAAQWIRRAKRVDEAHITGIYSNGVIPLRYSITFRDDQRAPRIVEEKLSQEIEDGPIRVFERSNGRFEWNPLYEVYDFLKVDPAQLRTSQTFLNQYKVPSDPTPIKSLSNRLSDIRIYRSFETGKRSPLRQGAAFDATESKLNESGSNLAQVLHELDTNTDGLDRLNEFLVEFAPHYLGIKPKMVNNAWTLQLREKGLESPTPTDHISDGTLRFLCLMAILLDPTPPPLICIEEPEIGLHPDAIALVGRAIEFAEEHTQLIVTTHSEALIDRFSDRPEAVLVCEKDSDNTSTLSRLNPSDLASWLSDYNTLGNLWQRGVLGGNRR